MQRSIDYAATRPRTFAVPDGDDWKIVRDERRCLTLIVPKKSKWDWKVDERHFRSLMIDDDGRVASSGMLKFGNLGEPGYEDHAEIFASELSKGTVRATEKLDGSLFIRSVHDGEVLMRTRGAIGLGDFERPIVSVIQQRYPALLDPEWMTDHSLHFEFISSDKRFQIVIAYQEDDLRLIGGIRNADLSLMRHHEVFEVADQANLSMVPHIELPHDEEALRDVIDRWVGKEGVVLSCRDNEVLVKVKSAEYLRLHRLLSSMSPKNVFALCSDENMQSIDDFKQHLIIEGADWELFTEVIPFVDSYMRAREDINAELKRCETIWRESKSLNDREFAVDVALKEPKHRQPTLFALRKGDKNAANDVLTRNILQRELARFKSDD